MIFTKDKSFYKTLIVLAIPIALQNLVTYAVGLADNVMIGSLGDTAVSGVYMGNQIQTYLQLASGGFEGTILILSAQYYGKGDTGAINKIISVGMKFSLAFGAVISIVCFLFPKKVIGVFTNEENVINCGAEYLSIVCLSYVFFCITQSLIAAMRSVKTTKIGLYVSICSLIVNVGLNFILIFGKIGFPKMGVRGAASATLIARIIEASIMIIYIRFFDKKLRLRINDLLKHDKAILKDFTKYGTPILAGQLVWCVNTMLNSVIMGHYSEEVIAAVSVANMLNGLAYVTINGLSAAVGIITGNTVGAGEVEKVKEYSKTVQAVFAILGIITGAFFLIIKNPFISFYNISPSAVNYSKQFITALSIIVAGTSYECATLFGLVKSGGDISFVFKNDTIFVFLVVIPSAIVAAYLGAPAWVVFVCLKCDQILKCFVAFFKIRKYDWMKNLTRN